MATRRFDLYVKADSSGTGTGDCPFSLKAVMYSKLKITNWSELVQTIPINLKNKPKEFLKLTKGGSTPVLVDKETGETVTDSAEIVQYLDEVFPDEQLDTHSSYDGRATEATANIFPKMAALLRNSDPSKTEDLKAALTAEFKKLDDFLSRPGHEGKFLLGDKLTELDCNLIPKLKHLVAANHLKNYQVPGEFKAVHEYINTAVNCPIFKSICPPDSEFIEGWKRHSVIPEPRWSQTK